MATNYENFNFHQNPQTFIEKIRQIFLIKSLGLRLLDTGTQVIMCQVLQFVGPDVSCTDIKSSSGSYRNIPLRPIQRVAILQGQTVHKLQIATFGIYKLELFGSVPNLNLTASNRQTDLQRGSKGCILQSKIEKS